MWTASKQRNPVYEHAWARFKRETNHDPYCQDPSVVPIGAYVNYLRRRKPTTAASAKSRTGCLSCIVLVAGSLTAFAWVLGKALIA